MIRKINFVSGGLLSSFWKLLVPVQKMRQIKDNTFVSRNDKVVSILFSFLDYMRIFAFISYTIYDISYF